MNVNIRDIYNRSANMSGGMAGVLNGSMLAIGSKGQVVEGVVSKVSNQISINFNGVEVAVPKTAVQNAREGETRKFKIMDVSKDNIVLKEVGNSGLTSDTVAVSHTTVSSGVNSGTYGYRTSTSGSSGSSDAAAAKTEMNKNLAVLTGDDYKTIEDSEGSVDKCEEEYVDKAVEKMKQQKLDNEENREENRKAVDEFEEELKKIQATGVLDAKAEAHLKKILENSDIPVTSENISRIVSALQMSASALNMSDDTKAYIVGNSLTPTIENIYHGQYSGSDAFDGSIYDTEVWEQISPQVERLIVATGLDSDSAVADAKWLFANDLPVTADTLKNMAVLNDISSDMSAKTVFEQIIQSVAAGAEPEQASLDTSEFVIARSIINNFAAITDADISTAVKVAAGDMALANENNSGDGVLNLELLRQAAAYNKTNSISSNNIPTTVVEGMSDMQVEEVMAKRCIAEICLKMTTQSVMTMRQKGIDVNTAPLEQVVEALRDEENSVYTAGMTGDVSDDELSLLHETMQQRADIANSPASLIGRTVRQQNLLKLNELHAAASSETYGRQQYGQIYEMVSTQVDASYGDSIQKAFASVPNLLKEIGMEDTNANERAVRILGYNGMEITEENVLSVKEYDTVLNRVIDNMKPSTVLEMIRQGDNPLDTSISDLDKKLADINASKDLSSEEKYSRYLWQLQKSGNISEQEREGYIGVYRLLNNIEKSDGAAIGAVLQSDREMTLGNLLTAVRTMKNQGIDTKIDDDFGGLKELNYMASSITDQINEGFGAADMAQAGKQDGSSDLSDRNRQTKTQSGQVSADRTDNDVSEDYGAKGRYFDTLVSDTLDEISPSKLGEISGGDMESVLDTSLEMFAQQIKEADGDKTVEAAYYDEKAKNLRSVESQSEQAKDMLNRLEIPATVENIEAAVNYVQNSYSPLRESYKHKDVLDRDEQEEFDDIIDGTVDSLDSEESIQKKSKEAEKYMEDILKKSYEKPDIKYDDLESLRMISKGIGLNRLMAERRSYDIPIKTGDTITNMNVTIISNDDDNGKIKVSISGNNSDEDGFSAFGDVTAELKVTDDSLKGYVFSSERQGYELLKESSGSLLEGLKAGGFEVKNISYGMNRVSQTDGFAAGRSDVDASKLYKAAKIITKHLVATMRQ
ncbi:hypothetical protein KQI69_09785 [Eubacterium sp. MSJ-13]|uniref:DUF6240 domain-containing protein n=1 Tax=Eubacterium sp. MSJ-13 TaxID=2841513 RepID=UPI001C1205FD|nr:DUF6240 domain-containing protein [Eubacterium sp. MSJ-13]MBU5479492.1 hypothetical protein [Eubacterium sp. MSJ-13]